MGAKAGGAFVLCVLTAAGQTIGSPDVEKALEDAGRVRRLVEAGALPRKALAEAELVLEEARDEDTLRRTLYGRVALEELTEEQADGMVAAAERLADRQRTELEKARKLVDRGALAATQLTPFHEELARREATVRLAAGRAALFRELVAMVRREEELTTALEQAPEAAPRLAQRFDGNGVFLASHFHLISLEFERRFAQPLPVSANGGTSLHRAMGFDHRGRVDVALHPDSAEGVWLRALLEELQIPYFAFRGPSPGASTGSHIHVGPPSPRMRDVN
jgi:hypothetical protein